MLTQDVVREWLDYNPETGDLIWKKKSGRKAAGQIAGTLGLNGYIQLSVRGKQLRAHQLVWIWHNGPGRADCIIDHIDGSRVNNRIENIREVNYRENNANKDANRKGKLAGATLQPSGRYQAKVTTGKHTLYLGTFDTAAEAHQRYTEYLQSISSDSYCI